MSKHEHCESVKIEAGQILHPDYFPAPNELVCVQIPKVFDQVAVRDCITRSANLIAGSGVINPIFSFEGIDDFDIVDVKVISKTDSISKAGYKKLRLAVKLRFNIFYSDGVNQLSQPDEVTFVLTVNEIYCPGCLAQIGVIQFPKPNSTDTEFMDEDGLMIKVEALAEAFNDVVHCNTLTFDIGIFAIVKCECVVQLLIPAYGYCPVPPEQQNPASLTCKIFNDKCKTPFPSKFFPDQKWNPLDKKECSEE